MNESAPWPHISVKMAARQLGVAPELIQGLCTGGQIDAVRAMGKDGRTPVFLVRRASVEKLKEQMSGVRL